MRRGDDLTELSAGFPRMSLFWKVDLLTRRLGQVDQQTKILKGRPTAHVVLTGRSIAQVVLAGGSIAQIVLIDISTAQEDLHIRHLTGGSTAHLGL